MQCQKCATPNKDSAKFCISCGSHLAAAVEPVPSTTACPQCQHHNKPQAKFCSKCGFSSQTQAVPTAPSVAAPSAQDAPALIPTGSAVESEDLPALTASSAGSASTVPPMKTEEQPEVQMPPAQVVQSHVAVSESAARNSMPSAVEPRRPAAPEEPAQQRAENASHSTAEHSRSAPASTLPKKASSVKPVALGISVAAVALVIAGGAWWFNRTHSAPVPDSVSVEKPVIASSIPEGTSAPDVPVTAPVSDSTTKEELQPQEGAAAQAEPAALPETTATAPTQAPTQPAVNTVAVTPQVSAEEVEAKKAAQLAKRKAAEDAKRKKAEEARAQAARDAQQAALAAQRKQPAPSPAPAAPRTLTTQERLAQCQTTNLFKREMCVWQVCANKWGQDGCPAYKSDQTTY